MLKDQKRLTCKECGYKSDNLVPHIEKAHATDGDAVSYYMEKHDSDVDDLVHPSLNTDASGDSMEKPKTKTIATVNVAGVEMPLVGKTEGVPSAHDGFRFLDYVKDICHDINERKPVALTGHTGVGKTSAILQIAARCGQPVIRIQLNGDTLISDFVGQWKAQAGEMIWIDGPLVKAVREGWWLIVDEVDFGPQNVVATMNDILEKGGKLRIKEKGYEVIEPHANFRIFATANTAGKMSEFRHIYQGTNIMNEAFLDRWRLYVVNYPTPEEEVKIVLGHLPRFSEHEHLVNIIVKVGNMFRDAFQKEQISTPFGVRRLLDWSELMLRHKNPIKAAEVSIFSKVSNEDAEVMKGIISRVMVGAGKKEAAK